MYTAGRASGVRVALLVAVMISVGVAKTRADDGLDIDYVADLMHAARLARRNYPDIVRINPVLDDRTLYLIQKQLIARNLAHGMEIAGFKGGFIPAAAVGGVLFHAGVLSGHAVIDRSDYVRPLVEAEIAFEFCTMVDAPIIDVAALKQRVCRVRPAVELPDAAIANFAQVKAELSHLRRLLIATNMASARVLLGASRPAATVDVNRVAVRVVRNGNVIGTRARAGGAADLWENVLWVVNAYALQQGYTVHTGQFIIPGALTGLHPGEPGSYELDYGDLGHLSFELID